LGAHVQLPAVCRAACAALKHMTANSAPGQQAAANAAATEASSHHADDAPEAVEEDSHVREEDASTDVVRDVEYADDPRPEEPEADIRHKDAAQ
jgi:hypothetical protein